MIIFFLKSKRFSSSQENQVTNTNINKISGLNQLISNEDYSKIESFYKSFGTKLHVTNNLASLYTVTLSDPSNFKPTLDTIVNLFMMNDEQMIAKQNWNVCHRGIPLWLFNTGANPRRPYRQLKFTLAEKGTGFILWQDRIDSRSDFKIFRKRKHETVSDQQQKQSSSFTLYHENSNSASSTEPSTSSSSSTVATNSLNLHNLVITFRASDRKTLVFVKFDVYQEVIKFFNYYLMVHHKLCEEIKQRTKSLPIGVGNEILKPTQQQKRSTMTHNYMQKPTQKCKKLSSTLENQNATTICVVKCKRISKNDISMPLNLKHLINVKLNDRNSYYTLSKLLPTNKINVDQETKISQNQSLSSSSSSASSPSSSLSTSSSINEKFIDCNQNNRYSLDLKNNRKITFATSRNEPVSTHSPSDCKPKSIK